MFKWIFGLLAFFIIVLFFHYTLPSRDIVQIVGTDIKRTDLKKDSTKLNRDVRLINAKRYNGDVIVYRNEDTGWGWPPYFKFDSSNLAAEAQALAREEEKWVAVEHYGWRIKVFSMFPNTLNIEVVDGPDTKLFPWFNIIILTVLTLVFLFIARSILAFKKHILDPFIKDIGVRVEGAGEDITYARKKIKNRIKGLLGRD